MAFLTKKKAAPEAAKEKTSGTPKSKNILTMDVKDIAQLLKPTPKSKKGTIKESKRTMNFVHHKKEFNVMKVVPVVAVLAAALSVFVRVGFLDMLDQKTIAYRNLASKQERLAAINTRLVDYEELASQYGRYSYGWMSEAEISLVNRLDVLNLVEQEITPYATLENFAVNNNVLTLNIHGITLENASAMVNRLEQSPFVINATIYSANAADGQEASIFLSINLMKGVQ